MSNTIFVFGSNLAGIHGAGAANYAWKNKGAKWKRGWGHHGDSYALPTKSFFLKTMSLHIIREYVDQFLSYAMHHPELTFQVTRVGCGLAGLKDSDMAPMFEKAPENCQFDLKWQPWLSNRKYWGTF